jgi:hypothetical protein
MILQAKEEINVFLQKAGLHHLERSQSGNRERSSRGMEGVVREKLRDGRSPVEKVQ